MNLRTERRRLRLVPRSLLGRMLLLTLLAVLLAQGLSSLIWLSQLRASQMEGLLASARSLAQSMGRASATSDRCRWATDRWCSTSCAAWAARASSSRSTTSRWR